MSKVIRCSFCGAQTNEKTPLIPGKSQNSFICCECIDTMHNSIKTCETRTSNFANSPSPQSIYDYLGQYVIGQNTAKKHLAVTVFNHYKRLQHAENHKKTDVEIDKSNVLLIGSTGTGKTLLAQTLARKLRVPIAIGDATTLTEAGYVGEDVENLLLKLLRAADGKIEDAERGIIVIDEIDKLRKTGGNVSLTRDVGGEGVQQSLLKMIEGTICNIPPQGGRKHPEQQYIQMNTSNILFIVCGSFNGLQDIIARRLGKGALGFHAQKENDKKFDKVSPEDLVEFGLIPELIGRLPVIVPMEELDEQQILQIITEPKNAIVKQYQKIAELANGSRLTFSQEALKLIAKLALEKKTGARAVRAVFETFMMDIMFQLPSQTSASYLIDADVVNGNRSLFAANQKAA